MNDVPHRVFPHAPGFDDFQVAQVHVSYARTLTETHLINFTAMAGLQLPLFIDRVHAAENTSFGGPIAPGFLTASLSAGMLESILGPRTLAGLGMDGFRFRTPVRIGDTLHAEVTIQSKKVAKDPTRGVLGLKIEVINQQQEVALEYQATVLMGR
jgi:acyl dehydratase